MRQNVTQGAAIDMSQRVQAAERYRRYRDHTRELMEEELLHALRRRVDVLSIGNDVLRKVRRDWYAASLRRVSWDWEQDIMKPLWSYGERTYNAAFEVNGQLCGLMTARVSPAKRWISLTHLEGSPAPDHPLKGLIVPLAIRSLLVFRGVICCNGNAKSTGVRILRPLEDAIKCYADAGFRDYTKQKREASIVVAYPQ